MSSPSSNHHLLDLGGAYEGNPNWGAPIQYDELRIKHDQGDVEIVVYNRAILLFFTDSEAVKRIHRVYCQPEEMRTPQRTDLHYNRRNRHAPYPSPERTPTKQRS